MESIRKHLLVTSPVSSYNGHEPKMFKVYADFPRKKFFNYVIILISAKILQERPRKPF